MAAWSRIVRSRVRVGLQVSVRPLPSRCRADTFSSMTWTPWHFLVVAVSGWMNREQQQVIDYLREENRILREKLGRKRIILNESQKQRLAAAAMKLGKDLLRQCGTPFSPATLLRWHRWFVARKHDGTGRRGPKPKKANSVRKLVLQIAEQNPSWGYGHIHGELKGLGIESHATGPRRKAGQSRTDNPGWRRTCYSGLQPW